MKFNVARIDFSFNVTEFDSHSHCHFVTNLKFSHADIVNIIFWAEFLLIFEYRFQRCLHSIKLIAYGDSSSIIKLMHPLDSKWINIDFFANYCLNFLFMFISLMWSMNAHQSKCINKLFKRHLVHRVNWMLCEYQLNFNERNKRHKTTAMLN